MILNSFLGAAALGYLTGILFFFLKNKISNIDMYVELGSEHDDTDESHRNDFLSGRPSL